MDRNYCDLGHATRAHDTVLSRSFTGRLARGIRNRVTQDFAACPDAILPFPIQGWHTGGMRKAALLQSGSDLIALSAGQAAPLLRHRHAGDLMEELVRDIGSVLVATARAAGQ